MPDGGDAAAYVIHGSDSHLVGEAVDSVRQALVGDRSIELVLSEFEGDTAVAEMLEAAWTPAFVTGRRVLVARLGAIGAADAGALADYLADPSPDAVLLISAGGRLPRDLSAALKSSGKLISTSAPAPHKRTEWVLERARETGLFLTPDAARYVAEVFGDAITSIGPFLAQLRVAFPEESRLGIDEVASAASGPRRGAAWDLTDSIDRGATEAALSYLAGAIAEGSHPLQILALLHGHFRRLARVVEREITSADAARELGVKQYPAEKTMAQAARLGERGVRRAIALLARADLELKGASAQQPDVILEMLVIRLCGLRKSAVSADR